MNKNSLRLTARIISAPIIIIAAIIAVGYGWSWLTTGVADPNAVEDYPWVENLPPLFLLGAVAGLAVAWFREKVGSYINLGFCLLTLIILPIVAIVGDGFQYGIPIIMVLVIAIPGALFFIFWKVSVKAEPQQPRNQV